MNIIFMGTPHIARSVLESIAPYINILSVYTRPDQASGRGKKIQYSPVKEYALAQGYIIEQPLSMRTEESIKHIAMYNPDCIIVVAYGAILPQEILSIPRYGVLNIHGSLLPYYRGAAPIQRSLWNGDKITGATIMQLDAGMDTGPILLQSSFSIEEHDTTYSVMQKMADIGARGLLRVLSYYMTMIAYPDSKKEELLNKVKEHKLYGITEGDTIQDYTLNPLAQDDVKASYAKKIQREEEYILWEDAQRVHYQLQALSYSDIPTASTILHREGYKALRVKLPLGRYEKEGSYCKGLILGLEGDELAIGCNKGKYFLKSIRPENKKDITARDFYNGYCKGKAGRFVIPIEE